MTEMLVLSDCYLDTRFLETLTNAIDKLSSPVSNLKFSMYAFFTKIKANFYR